MAAFDTPNKLSSGTDDKITSGAPSSTDYIVIGKIPGYNNNINNKLGKNNTKLNYEERLKHNLTTIKLRPTGYQINFSGMMNEVSDAYKNTLDWIFNKKTNDLEGADTSIYKIGGNVKLGSHLKAATGIVSDKINISTSSAVENWYRLVRSNIPSVSHNVNELRILATNDSTMTEVFGNSFDMSSAERLANKIGDHKAAQFSRDLKKITTVDSSTGMQMLSNSKSAGTLNLLAGKALGIQTSLPREWVKSDYNNSLQLMIKLVSPSGDDESIKEYILKPLKFLILSVSPISYDGINFGYPTLWEVLADGMMDIQLAGVSAMTITRGGNETQFNRYNQPLNIDVRLTIEPLINGFASLASGAKYKENIEGTIDDNYKDFMVTNPSQLDVSFYKEAEELAQYKTINL